MLYKPVSIKFDDKETHGYVIDTNIFKRNYAGIYNTSIMNGYYLFIVKRSTLKDNGVIISHEEEIRKVLDKVSLQDFFNNLRTSTHTVENVTLMVNEPSYILSAGQDLFDWFVKNNKLVYVNGYDPSCYITPEEGRLSEVVKISNPHPIIFYKQP